MIDITCVVAAALFEISNVIFFVIFGKYRNRSHFKYETFTQLEPSFIQQEWEFRIDNRSLELAAGIMNALAWFVLALPILQVAWIQSNQGKRQLGIHVGISVLALGGSISELLAQLLTLGGSNTAEWIAKDFNLNNWTGEDSNDQIGWRTLEVAYLIMRGMILWIDAIEWLFLFGILTLLYFSVRSQQDRLLGLRWAHLGLVLALLCIIDFAADVLRLESWRTFSRIAMFTSLISRLIILPVWLIWLARMLPNAKEKMNGPEIPETARVSGTGPATENEVQLT